LETTRTVHSEVLWAPYEPIARDRIISGTPEASTLVTATFGASEVGLWRVTEGEFTTDHAGYVEFMHIVEGEGELIRDDGSVLALSPGVTITMGDWRGRWVVRTPIVKAFAILRR
jgi:uncharacterized protein